MKYLAEGFEFAAVFPVSPRDDELFECNGFFVRRPVAAR